MSEQYVAAERTNTPRASRTTYYDNDTVSIAAPKDRVRWASVLAGLFTVLASLAFFTVLGVAIGAAAYDPGEPASNFGAGAGIYGIIAALISYFFGGFIAARTAAVAGTGNAILNGAMVWIVTVALIVNFIGTGIGTLLGTATDVATTAAGAAAQIAAPAVQEAVEDPAAGANAQDAAANAAAGVQGAVQDAQQQLQSVTPQQIDQAAEDVSRAAWMALLALGVSALAAIIGGVAGTRRYPTDVAVANT